MSNLHIRVRQHTRERYDASGLLIESFHGKTQALPLDFAYACGSPSNENDQ